MEWKGPREWAIERDSIKNKKRYADRWGYHLEITDMSTKKRYAHEWRESWEKVDLVRNAMAKYPNAEWLADPPSAIAVHTLNFDWQVLVARLEHLHHGAFLLPPIPHL